MSLFEVDSRKQKDKVMKDSLKLKDTEIRRTCTMSQEIIDFRTTERSALEPDLLDLDFTIRALRLSFLA